MNGTDFRLFYERYAIYKLAEYLKIHPKSIKHLTKKNIVAISDAEYNGKKYDIKFAIPSLPNKEKKIAIWDFDLHKQLKGKIVGHFGSDYLLCIGMLKGIPSKIFLIPTDIAPKRHLRISIKGKSKWHEYEI